MHIDIKINILKNIINNKMYFKSFVKNIYFLIVTFLLSSCFSEKKITYFQQRTTPGDTIQVADPYIPKIHTGDILSIFVSSLSSEASSYFNPYLNSPAVDAGGVSNGLSQSSAPGYLVDADGNIELPLIGAIHVGGYTTAIARDTIKNRLKIYLKEPIVNVRFLNFRISILGEVKSPGIYVIPNERITIPEALVLAGDITNYAKSNDIQIIRDVDSRKEFGSVDLTSRSIFTSKYYYLHANDMIYVKANKNKVTQTDIVFKVVPFFIGIATALVFVISNL